MKDLRRNFERFCYRNQHKGIRNLMMYVALGNIIVYLFAMTDPSGALVRALQFSRDAIFSGQVWRLITYILVPTGYSNPLVLAIMLFFYFQIGKILENRWGVFRFNLYYLCGIVITDIAALIMGVPADIGYLNLSLILAFATLCPEDRVLLLYIIPIKMKYLAWFYFGSIILTLLTVPFPINLFPLFALLNYILFFGSDIKNVLPGLGYYRPARKPKSDKQNPHAAPNPKWAENYKASNGQKPYRHKCTVCGKTDTEYPDLEFRYCSRCNGYYCYCLEHINNHSHIQ